MNFGVLLALAISSQVSTANENSDACGKTKIMNCFPTSQATEKEKLFFPDTQEKLQSNCNQLIKSLNCAKEFAEKCTSEEDKILYKNLTKDIVTVNSVLCTADSSLNQRFLKHANCYKELSPKFETCSNRFIENIIAAQRLNQTQLVLKTCCSVHDYSCCMRNVVTGRCEKDASEFVEEIVVKTLESSLDYCNQYTEVVTTNCRKCLATQHGLSTNVEADENNGATQHFTSSTTSFCLLLTFSTTLARILAK